MKKMHKLLFFLALSLINIVQTCFGMESKKLQEFSAKQKTLGEKLVQAAHDRDDKQVKELLRKGAPIDYQEHLGKSTALHWAAHEDNFAMVLYLLIQRANPNITNDMGDTPLHFVFEGYKGRIGYNLDNVKKIITILIENKANVNAINNGKQTPYYRASLYHIDVFELLKKHGAYTQNSPEYECIPKERDEDDPDSEEELQEMLVGM